MSHGQIPWYTGAKIFKEVFEKFRKEVVRPSRSCHSSVQGRQKKKSGTPQQRALLYTGAKFFYLQELEKFIQRYILWQIFPIFAGEKIGKIQKCAEMGLVEE